MTFAANDLKCDKHGAHNLIQVKGQYDCPHCIAEERDNLRQRLDRVTFKMATLKKEILQLKEQVPWQKALIQPRKEGGVFEGLKKLTERQREILVFICTMSHNKGRCPTLREIGEKFYIGHTGARYHLEGLRDKGYLPRKPGHPIEVSQEIREEFAEKS